MLKSDRMQLEGQKHLSDQNQAIQDTLQELDTKVTDISNRHPNINISDAVETAIAKEYQSEIDDTRVLLETCRPKSALDQFKKLKERIWTDAPPIVKFRILINMAAAHFELNNEQNAAELLREAFQYNSEDEKAFSNRALAHYLLGNWRVPQNMQNRHWKKILQILMPAWYSSIFLQRMNHLKGSLRKCLTICKKNRKSHMRLVI